MNRRSRRAAIGAWLCAGVIAAAAGAKETHMVTISGVVQSCEVRDVSKRAGKRNPRSYLAITVETTTPPELQAKLPATTSFIGDGKFGALSLTAGARVAVQTYYDGRNVPAQFDIYDLQEL